MHDIPQPFRPNISQIAALIGDPARGAMLLALMQGGALTVSELAVEAGVGLPTASWHLTQLQAGGLVVARKSGRHKYLELASPEVAGVVETLMALSGGLRPMRRRPGPRDAALRQARVCYDHLAGAMGVRMYHSLIAQGHLVAGPDGASLTPQGHGFAMAFGIGAEALRPGRPPLCRDCLDWSERQTHLAGRLGRSLLTAMECNGWLRRTAGSRAITVTAAGEAGFARAFPLAGGAGSGSGAAANRV